MGPEAVVALLVGTAIANDEDPQQEIDDARIMALMIGLLCFGMGLFRLGFLDNIFSRSLLEGFVLASAFLIIVEQLRPLLGIEAEVSQSASTFTRLGSLITHLDQVDGYTVAFGLPSLAFLIIMGKLRTHFPASAILKFFPSVLFVVILSTVICWATRADEHGVAVLGVETGGFFTPSAPPLGKYSNTQNLFANGAIVFVVGFVEASATAKRFSCKYNYAVSPNRELVALGLANFIASFFGSYPVFASFPRTVLADSAGARTQATGFFVFLIVMVTIGLLVPLFHYLPRAVTAAIVFKAGMSLAHFDQIKFVWRVRAYKDGFLMFVTFMLTLAVGVATGVFVGLALSVIMIIKESTLPHLSILGLRENESSSSTDDDDNNNNNNNDTASDLASDMGGTTAHSGILVIQFGGVLNFANTGQVRVIVFCDVCVMCV